MLCHCRVYCANYKSIMYIKLGLTISMSTCYTYAAFHTPGCVVNSVGTDDASHADVLSVDRLNACRFLVRDPAHDEYYDVLRSGTRYFIVKSLEKRHVIFIDNLKAHLDIK